MKRLKIKNWLFLKLALFFVPLQLVAQNVNEKVEMADQFRSDGKIYIVVVVMLTIILGMSFFAFRIDRKITNLEKRMNTMND